MSRKYMNERWCVRCGKTSPTPYLKKNLDLLIADRDVKYLQAIDIGCGNGRNSEFLKENNICCDSYDMINDYGKKLMLGHEPFPNGDMTVDIILANYILMFLNYDERKLVLSEILRVADDNCRMMLELYPAKDSFCTTKEESLKLQQQIFDTLGWGKVRYSQERFIIWKK